MLQKSIYWSLHDTSPHRESFGCFSMEITKTSPKHPNIRKPLYILTIPKSKINLSLKMTMTPKNFRKLRSEGPFENTSSIKSRTMCKPAHRLVRQFNALVSTRRRFLLKGASGQTSLLPLSPHYLADFIADLVLVFVVIISQVVFYTISTFAYNFGTLFKTLSSLWNAIANFSFRYNIHRFVDVLYD